ncbi:hypothetical protein RAS1_11010 [Phycisphaerae bacterium RAS1]|nr:hypothetical protein RAS1_11010 [Phycisphaerae bacterium RAS1]
MHRCRARILLLALGAATAQCGGTIQSLGGLVNGGDTGPSYAFGISADGLVVVGWSQATAGPEGFRWTPVAGMVGLGDLPGGGVASYANGVSADGQTVVGRTESASGTEAFRWTVTGGMAGLGGLSDAPYYSEAWGTSANGWSVAGISTTAASPEMFRWTPVNGLVGLGGRTPDVFRPMRISNNGNTIAATRFFTPSTAVRAFVWTFESGAFDMPVPEEVTDSEVGGLSVDGRYVLGGLYTLSGASACYWRIDETVDLVQLGTLSGDVVAVAQAIRADGHLIVGYSGDRAFIWDPVRGMRTLWSALVNDYGVSLNGWQTLDIASAMTPDGRFIIGHGRRSNGRTEAYRIELSLGGGTGDMNCDGAVNVLDINPFAQALLNPSAYYQLFPSCDIFNADANHDGSVDVLDINPFVVVLESQ